MQAEDAPGPPIDTIGRREFLRGLCVFAAALAACALAYLLYDAPGNWFPRATRQAWDFHRLTLTRGSGGPLDQALVISQADAGGTALVSLTTDFRADEYPGIAWIVDGLADRADVRLLWRSDTRPDKLNSVSLRVEGGRALPIELAKNPGWVGRVTGLALAIRGPLAQPVRVYGAAANPMGLGEILRDRLNEWLAFERWNGASINTITGGADVQDLPLPLLIATVVAIGGVGVLVAARWRPTAWRASAPTLLAIVFLLGWLALDARWTWNLARQERVTATQFGGKDERGKYLAGEDAPLYAFIEKARGVLPTRPARIFVAADADYFRGRAAYHLYPHNVYFSARGNAMPPASALRAGDWLLVFLQHGVQFDASQGKLRWDGTQIVNGEPRLVEPGAALFEIR